MPRTLPHTLPEILGLEFDDLKEVCAALIHVLVGGVDLAEAVARDRRGDTDVGGQTLGGLVVSDGRKLGHDLDRTPGQPAPMAESDGAAILPIDRQRGAAVAVLMARPRAMEIFAPVFLRADRAGELVRRCLHGDRVVVEGGHAAALVGKVGLPSSGFAVHGNVVIAPQ